MCLILFALQTHPKYPLILAANRDEFLARPTQQAHLWENPSGIIAGKDLKQGGTWLGITRSGRLAALTNFRSPTTERPGGPSRGNLVLDYLASDTLPAEFLEKIAADDPIYSGYNLLVGEFGEIWYHGNQKPGIEQISSGIHGLSNALLDTPWWKVEQGKARLAQLVSDPAFSPETHADKIFALMRQPARAPQDRLPVTGVAPEWEAQLSSMFIDVPGYGTRCSTFLAVAATGEVHFEERTWQPEAGRMVERFTIAP